MGLSCLEFIFNGETFGSQTDITSVGVFSTHFFVYLHKVIQLYRILLNVTKVFYQFLIKIKIFKVIIIKISYVTLIVNNKKTSIKDLGKNKL